MKMNLGAITQAMMEDPWFDVQEPLEINEGDCFRWAYVAYLIYGGTLVSFENKWLAHAFIKIDGKYYDSESPDGVNDWRELMFFKEHPTRIRVTLPIEMEERKFADFWHFKPEIELPNVLKRTKEIINDTSLSR